MKDNKDDLLCPSAPLTKESYLFGVLNEQAEVQYLDSVVPVTEELLAGFQHIEQPEKHFRFTMTCGKDKCAQWDNNKCSVGSAIQKAEIKEINTKPARCGIRKACRWYSQEGLAACVLCKYVVTDASI